MVRALTMAFAIAAVAACGGGQAVTKAPEVDPLADLAQLDEAGDVFALRDRLASMPPTDEPILLLYRAAVADAFNRPAEAREAARAFLAAQPDASNVHAARARSYVSSAFVREHRYADAFTATVELYEQHGAYMYYDHREQLRAIATMWQQLRDVPPQTVSATGDTSVTLRRDAAAMLRLDASIGGVVSDVMIDTGANRSAITRSLAARAGLTVIPAAIEISPFVGPPVEADLAVLDELVIGNHTLHHVVFWVFDDAALAGLDDVECILGFPVFEALGELRFHGDARLDVPATPTPRAHGNLALSGRTPLVRFHHGDDAWIASLDTGASATALLTRWYFEHRVEIDAAGYPKVTFEHGVLGGVSESEGFVIPDLTIELGGQSVTLENVRMIFQGGPMGILAANIGQDVLQQYEVVVIDFRSMAFELVNPL